MCPHTCIFTYLRVCSNATQDGDGVPNYLDVDSDADGVSDLTEGTGDEDAGI